MRDEEMKITISFDYTLFIAFHRIMSCFGVKFYQLIVELGWVSFKLLLDFELAGFKKKIPRKSRRLDVDRSNQNWCNRWFSLGHHKSLLKRQNQEDMRWCNIIGKSQSFQDGEFIRFHCWCQCTPGNRNNCQYCSLHNAREKTERPTLYSDRSTKLSGI